MNETSEFVHFIDETASIHKQIGNGVHGSILDGLGIRPGNLPENKSTTGSCQGRGRINGLLVDLEFEFRTTKVSL